MKSIDDLRELMGETEDRIYDGMSMAEMFAIFIERMNADHRLSMQRIADVEARSNDLHTRIFERINSLDKLTQELYRMIKIVNKPTRYNHWTDGPR